MAEGATKKAAKVPVMVDAAGSQVLLQEWVSFQEEQYRDEAGNIDLEKVTRALAHSGECTGRRLADRMAVDKEHFGPTTNIIKFLCRDIWSAVFGSNIERLQTNNSGMYVLHQSAHSPLLTLSHPDGQTDTAALVHLLFPCGLIKGFLGAFGVDATVDARVTGTHAAYHIQMRQYDDAAAATGAA